MRSSRVPDRTGEDSPLKISIFYSVVVVIGGTLALPVYASFIGDIVGTSSDFTNEIGFNGPAVLINDDVDSDPEFSGEMPLDEVFIARFNFAEDVLYIDVRREHSGPILFGGFSVNFTEIDWVGPFAGQSITGYEFTFDDHNYTPDPPTDPEDSPLPPVGSGIMGSDIGVTWGPASLSIAFDSFALTNTRYVAIQLFHSGSLNPPSVVPVPAAAPMVLLGLGVLALARRFRRAKS